MNLRFAETEIRIRVTREECRLLLLGGNLTLRFGAPGSGAWVLQLGVEDHSMTEALSSNVNPEACTWELRISRARVTELDPDSPPRGPIVQGVVKDRDGRGIEVCVEVDFFRKRPSDRDLGAK